MSTDEEVPMMSLSRGITESGSINVTSQATTKEINGINYTFKTYDSTKQTLTYTVNDGEIIFSGRFIIITGDENATHNIKLNGDVLSFHGGQNNDKITLNGSFATIYSKDGDDEIILEKDTKYSYINLGNGTDKITTNNYTIESGAIVDSDNNYTSTKNLSSVFLYNSPTSNDNKNYLDIAYGQPKTVEIEGIEYKFASVSATLPTSISWYYDTNSKKILFAGNNVRITGQKDVAHNVALYGDKINFYGGEKNDIINAMGGYQISAYGNDGNDTLISEYGVQNAKLYGGNGNDTIIGSSSYGTYDGSAGDDSITINSNTYTSPYITQSGGDGNDNYEINTSVNITDDSGKNTYYVNTSDITLTTGTSNDTFYINADNVKVETSGGDNKFYVNGNNNTVTSSDGNDIFEVVGNGNKIDGGAGENSAKIDGDTEYSNINKVEKRTPLNIKFQVGSEAGQDFEMDLDFNLGSLNLDFSSSQKARGNISKIDDLIDEVNMELSNIGANINRLESAYELQNIDYKNLSEAKSLITDCDIAFEASKNIELQILQQVSTSLFAQANNDNLNLVSALMGGIKPVGLAA